ncbi:MAG: ABC transporter ATP-binding protein, partial [Planctomycetes bacterium]|nr:ABC transporter ATP-binding protein [Planctomycetota bacterium]
MLELSEVGKVYGTAANPLTVLREINFRVDSGEYVAIVGPSGAGKSTMLNILGCLDRPSSGSYRLMGENVAELDDQRLSHVRKTRVGFVFQSFQLISHLTVLENVEMPLFYSRVPRRERHKRCRELIEQVGLTERTTHLPSQLSGGENQRAAIARALANDPPLLVCDEPTGNLDTESAERMFELFGRLVAEGKTLLMVTHSTELAHRTQRVLELVDG